MKAMILAAGRGERLRPLTDHTPKPLLQAGKYRLIEHLIFSLRDSGIDEIVINHAHLGSQFPEKLGNGENYGVRIVFSAEEEGGLETAGGIIKALPLLGNEPFLVVNGDIWTDYPFSKLADLKLKTNQLCHTVLVKNPAHNPDGDFSISHDGKLEESSSNRHTFSGIAVYDPRLFSSYSTQRLALKPVLQEAISKHQATAEFYEGDWSDIGTIERLEQLRQSLG